MKQVASTYASVGVDIDTEAKAARILYEASKKTWANRKGKLGEVVVPFDDFAGLRFIRADKLPAGTVMYGGSDGVATKAELAERLNTYDTLAYDLMAMVCDDAVIRGGEPVLVKSVLDVNTLGSDDTRLPFIEQLASGYEAAAAEAGVAVINGEIAQLNDRIGHMERFCLEWSADLTWFAHESRLITGYDVKPGDSIIALQETGLRCNGISLVRKILKDHYGDDWHTKSYQDQSLGELALQPSQIYSPAVVAMFGGYSLDRAPQAKIHAAAHISGGGIAEKLGRMLRASGYGAKLDNLFTPGKLMLHCQELGNVADEEAYKTWNMGNGMLIITPEPDAVLSVAAEHGMAGQLAGHVQDTAGITITNKGYFAGGQKEVQFN